MASIRAIPKLAGYVFERRIGQGAHATISLARDKTSRQLVAIKHVTRRGPDDDRYIEQAEAEFEVARRFEHPALRRCLDIHRVKQWLKIRELYLVMEYVDGDTLERQFPQTLPEVIRVFSEVAEGLHALHTMGYVHADIKPNNILMTKDGGLKIIDFGQSCPIGHTKERVQGTPDYMAPEQVLRHPIDQRTDVFNLGATLYWGVTGVNFDTLMPGLPTGAKKIDLEARRGNRAPHEVNPEVPLPLSRLIMDCCETNREARPRDMKQFIARLELVQHVLNRKEGAAANGSTPSAPVDEPELSESPEFPEIPIDEHHD